MAAGASAAGSSVAAGASAAGSSVAAGASAAGASVAAGASGAGVSAAPVQAPTITRIAKIARTFKILLIFLLFSE